MCALLSGLPPDAAVNRDGKQWTSEREFAAYSAERVDFWGARTVELLTGLANFKTDGERRKYCRDLPDTIKFTHPDRVERRRQANVTSSLSDAAAFFARAQRR